MDNNNNNRQTPNGYGGISWLLIAVMFAFGLWPIAMILLFLKLFAPNSGSQQRQQHYQAPSLSEQEARRQAELKRQQEEKERAAREAKAGIKSMFDSPKEGKSTSVVLIALGAAFILLSLLIFSGGAGATPTIREITTLIASMLSGGAIIYSGVSMSTAMKRYARYASIIGKNDAFEIESLATKTGYSKRRVTKDLQKMVEKGYFGDSAYVNKELGYFFASSQADKELAQAKKAALEKTAEAAKNEAAKQTASVYDNTLTQIRDLNGQIPGEEMTEKISEIENLTKSIFDEVQKDPKKRSKIDRFMSYYLPTTLKLLEHYASLDSTNVEGENISKSKKSIEDAMDSIVDGFKRQLDELYKNETLDIETDIDVMMQMMERDKRKTGSAFTASKTEKKEETASTSVDLGGSAAQTK